MKKTIVLNLITIIFVVNLFSETYLKIPKANKISVKTFNTVEKNAENENKYSEQDYPRISKNKILVNCIDFYDENGKLLISSDKMDINIIRQNTDSNVYLCLQYEDLLNLKKKNYLYLFDFKNGKREQIDVDVNNFLLSNDGKIVYYISKFNFKESSEMQFSMYKKNKRKTITINYKDFTDEPCDSLRLKLEKEGLSLYIYQDACVIVKLFVDSNCNITNFVLSEYDEELGMSYIKNPDGSIEYLE